MEGEKLIFRGKNVDRNFILCNCGDFDKLLLLLFKNDGGQKKVIPWNGGI
jgi:hypothetical protein